MTVSDSSTPQRPGKAVPTAHNERLMNTVVNLVYVKPRTAEDLAKLLRVSTVTVKAVLERLMDDRRVYETRSRRKTSFHAVVLQGVPPATHESDKHAEKLRSVLARSPHKKFTVGDLSTRTGESPQDTLVQLNSGILAGWVTFLNIGALRVYGLDPNQEQHR